MAKPTAQTSPAAPGRASERIPVHISYEIIRLFSEGLYQSPHKAIEELVSNSYDAGATEVRVLLPDHSEDDGLQPAPLWVIDNGVGMDDSGFFDLWRVASSKKGTEPNVGRRQPIGQFGIGKLAAYVLAWRLTHVSKAKGKIHATIMNFHDLKDLHQYEPTEPFELDLVTLTDTAAKELLGDIQHRDPEAWTRLFGKNAEKTWTVAGLDDFKSLYEKLSVGRLRWVLSTGLPLHSDFSIYVEREKLESSKESIPAIAAYKIGGEGDKVAAGLTERYGITAEGDGIVIPGIDGVITGSAVIYERRLTEGKSDRFNRSHGFFVRVRGRVINLEDELFGIEALNHSAWSRFSMEVDADGLRDHLLSSREGVRGSIPIDGLRKYLHGVFNYCRKSFDDWQERQNAGLDLDQLLRDAPSLFVTEPMVAGVRRAVESGSESYYIDAPNVEGVEDLDAWIDKFAVSAAEAPIAKVMFEATGQYDRVLHFVPETRTLIMNTNHPYVEKLISMGRTKGAAALFGSSEVLLDLLLQDHGVPMPSIIDMFDDRDRSLRLLAGDQPSTAEEILRLLRVANRSDIALERAIGAAFRSLGFEYERRGGNVEGTDGVLYARLGRGTNALADYKVVYDAKQTNSTAVPADKVNIDSLEDFRASESAQYGFFLAEAYAAQANPTGKLNRLVSNAVQQGRPITLLRIDHLRRLVEVHYQYGVTLTDIQNLFETAHTVPEVDEWINELERRRITDAPVPLQRLLDGIERAKKDTIARPNIKVVRALDPVLSNFSPERLIAVLSAVEEIIGRRWIEVEQSGDVRLHHTVDQIVAEVERLLRRLLGVNSLSEGGDMKNAS